MKIYINPKDIGLAVFTVFAFSGLSLLMGCTSKDDLSAVREGTATLSFNVALITNDKEESSMRKLPLSETVNRTQADGTLLTFTLSPEMPSAIRAASTMTPGNKYKITVLDNAGKIVYMSVDGVAGTATDHISIDQTKPYTLVAYSYNDASSSLPSPGSGGSVPSAVAMEANKDVLYFNESLAANTLSAGANLRSITFNHKYSKVKVVMDATSLGSDITVANGLELEPSYHTTLKVSDGTVSKSGGSITVPITFPTLNAQRVTSNSAILFSNEETPLILNIPSVTIGGTTYTGNKVTFTRALVSGFSYTLTVNAHLTIPNTITLGQNQAYLIPSVYDEDFLPYTAPTSAATLGTLPADGNKEATKIDIQGSITTSGTKVRIPVSVTGGGGMLPAYSTTITLPGTTTQDASPHDVNLSWDAQLLNPTHTFITATIKAVGSTLNAKKLDINAGIGNNFQGVLVGQFVYPYNNAGQTTAFQLKVIGAIPDKMYGVIDNNGNPTSHRMLYLPILGADGKIWLSNNLGADYANTNHASFNPTKRAASATDYLAYGSLFQWGRKPDGHELITWTQGAPGTIVNGITSTLNDVPNNALFIKNNSGANDYDWMQSGHNNNLWSSEASANNPCPMGFRVPTDAELTSLITVSGINNGNEANLSTLKFTLPGYRAYNDGAAAYAGNYGYYWSSSVNGSDASYRYFSSVSTNSQKGYRANGYSVRCVIN